MTEEEKKAQEAAEAVKAAEAAAEAGDGASDDGEPDALAEKDKIIQSLEEERDNYKAVALKRLGKLPGDKEFSETELSVAEQVKLTLLERELENAKKAKDSEIEKMKRENNELKLALKNRPDGSIGSESNSTSVETKDNVFNAEQLKALAQKAKSLGADPEKFIENAKRNFLNKR